MEARVYSGEVTIGLLASQVMVRPLSSAVGRSRALLMVVFWSRDDYEGNEIRM